MTPQETFQKMLIDSGLQAYHDAGYRGQNAKILNCEAPGKHGTKTGTILPRCAPAAKTYCHNVSIATNGDILERATIDVNGVPHDFATFVKENKIDIITASLGGNNRCKGWVTYCEKMQEETGVLIFNSAGNKSAGAGETLDTLFPPSVAIIVGAVNGSKKRISYSSVGAELDFMAFSGLATGTSTAGPFLACMAACELDRSGKKTPSENKEWLKSIAIDLGKPGDDNENGEGMPILGDPNKQIEPKAGDGMLNIIGNLVEHFALNEMANNEDGGRLKITPEVVRQAQMMEELRKWYNKPMKVNSWYRTKEYNVSVGGDPNSCHLDGIATDIALTLTDSQRTNFINKWKDICKKWGVIGGVSIYDTFLHFDSNNTPTRYGKANSNFRVTDFR